MFHAFDGLGINGIGFVFESLGVIRLGLLPKRFRLVLLGDIEKGAGAHGGGIGAAGQVDGLAACPNDFGTLIEAFAEVRKQRAARLLILGEGVEREKLERLVKSLGLQDDVLMPGYVENPFPYLKRARVFVLSSVYEGMPNVLLQAMAFGTPVVATDCDGGAKDAVSSLDLGRLVRTSDSHAMAAAIIESLELPRNDIAAKFVADRFSVERATREYLHAAGL